MKPKDYTKYFEKPKKKINLCVRIQALAYLSEARAWKDIADFKVACNILHLFF